MGHSWTPFRPTRRKLPPSLEEIERALAALPDEQREAFVLRHVEEMSFEEMAEITGAGVSGLTMRVKRATGRVRDAFAPLLRTVERLSGGFEGRLLGRVRDEKAAEVQRQTKHPRSWWIDPTAGCAHPTHFNGTGDGSSRRSWRW